MEEDEGQHTIILSLIATIYFDFYYDYFSASIEQRRKKESEYNSSTIQF